MMSVSPKGGADPGLSCLIEIFVFLLANVLTHWDLSRMPLRCLCTLFPKRTTPCLEWREIFFTPGIFWCEKNRETGLFMPIPRATGQVKVEAGLYFMVIVASPL